LGSLKLAVRTPGTRISLVDPSTAPRTVLGKISWEGGFLDGVALDLSDELTTLIGGRGTGKSTVIESIRFALDLEPLGPEAKKDYLSMVKNVLGPGATVVMTVRGVGPSLETYEVTRTVDQAPIVRDSAGTVSQLSAKDVIGAIEVFGQHELAELAHDKDNVAAMVQRFAGPDNQSEDESDVQLRLQHNRAHLASAEADLARLDAELADLPRLEEQIRIFTESDLGEKLKDQQLLQKDEAIIAATTLRIDSLAASLLTVTNDDIPGDLRAELEGLEQSPRAATLADLSAALEAAAMTVEAALESIKNAVDTARLGASKVQTAWTNETNGVRQSTAETLRKLKDEGNDPGEFVATSRALQGLMQKASARPTHEVKIRTLRQERTDLLGELQISHRAKAQRLRQAIREANEATDGTVNVRPVESPHREHIKQLISSHVTGARTTIMSAVESDGFNPSVLADSARLGRDSLEEKFGIRGAQATNLRAAGELLFRQLEETSVGLAADVFLDVSTRGDPREYRKLEDLSKGQRATALLLLLLGASAAPLVIDQPEDDLDNRFVFSGVVKRLRSLKGQRQVILSTHNANIPVLGDAELVIALEGSVRKGQPIANGIGSLDNPTIRQLAEDLLEGGSAAFGARHHLYGF
jgi:DNA repair ATPase RecN